MLFVMHRYQSECSLKETHRIFNLTLHSALFSSENYYLAIICISMLFHTIFIDVINPDDIVCVANANTPKSAIVFMCYVRKHLLNAVQCMRCGAAVTFDHFRFQMLGHRKIATRKKNQHT